MAAKAAMAARCPQHAIRIIIERINGLSEHLKKLPLISIYIVAHYIPHICHLYHLWDMWRKICHVEKFLQMTDVEKCEITPHVEKFQNSPHLSCIEIWNFSTWQIFSPRIYPWDPWQISGMAVYTVHFHSTSTSPSVIGPRPTYICNSSRDWVARMGWVVPLRPLLLLCQKIPGPSLHSSLVWRQRLRWRPNWDGSMLRRYWLLLKHCVPHQNLGVSWSTILPKHHQSR